MNVPWNIETAHSEASKHFVLHYLRSWGWDFLNLRDAIRAAYKVDKVGKNKYEVYVQKKGFRKISRKSANFWYLIITGKIMKKKDLKEYADFSTYPRAFPLMGFR